MLKIKSFFRLSSDNKSLLIRSLILTLIIRLLLYFASFSRVYQISNRLSRRYTNHKNLKKIEDIIWSVKVASNYIPRSTCLVQAITAQILLANNNYPSSLRIGVSKSDGFEAHAWVELNKRIILGESDKDFILLVDL